MSTYDGREFQLANLDIKIAGTGGQGAVLHLDTFVDVSFEDGAEKKPVYNKAGEIVGYTFDNQKTAGSITILRSEWFTLQDWAADEFPDVGVGEIEMDWSITFGNNLAKLRTEKILGVMFQKDPRKAGKDQEALTVELPLFIRKVIDSKGRSFVMYPQAQ